ncbi:MAG: hypothetical protein ACEQSK_00990 [Sphingomonadaceae bacterium]
MKVSKVVTGLLASAAAMLIGGCAATPAGSEAGAPQVASAAPVKCKATEAATGTSIVRKDCSGNPNVTSVDAREMLDSKRVATPSR